MGFVTCGIHPRQRCCWRCDKCPKCDGPFRLQRGDFCPTCVRELIALGYVWSEESKNYVEPAATGQRSLLA